MQFAEIIGQEEVKERLIQTVKDERVSHAQLFFGLEGSGALAMAVAYAQFLSCLDKKAEDSCGECSSCIKYNKLVHPDLHFAFPVATNKDVTKEPVSNDFIYEWREAFLDNPYLNLFQWLESLGIENKQGLISVNESSEILKKLSLKTFEAEYKIMIIWMPEKMNNQASNKLLKILEEPPDKTLFLLVTQDQDQLLQTIISRTQLLKLRKLEDKEVADALVQRYSVSDKEALEIAKLSDGNFTRALSMIRESEGAAENFSAFQNWMRVCYKRDVAAALDIVDIVSSWGRERQKNFLQYGLNMVRECIMYNYSGAALVKLGGEQYDFASKFSQFINHNNCIQVTNELNKAHYELERNVNFKILFFDLSLKFFGLIRQSQVN